MNRLYFGDNLEVLNEHVADESVDLIYLDPPFNSKRNYSVIFGKNREKDESAAQIQAFEDTWRWTPRTERLHGELSQTAPRRVADTLAGFYTLLDESEALAYLVNMTPRLLELHRVLKPTGKLFLHCDPVMSHYIKILLDAIFGPTNFINDIAWKRSANTSSISKVFRRAHDCLLFYAKSKQYGFNIQYGPLSASGEQHYSQRDELGYYSLAPLMVSGKRAGDTGQPWRGIDPSKRGKDGMHWVTTRDKLDEYDAQNLVFWPSKTDGAPRLKYYKHQSKGVSINDFWDDISLINSQARESVRYPTQKPLALLERVIRAASNPGDVVLDPFCGCGTTVDAAQRLGREWIGIDISYLAVDVIVRRLNRQFGDEIFKSIDIGGIPKDLGGARALFDDSPFEFERWAVSMINAEPNERQVGDKGVDGVARFPLGEKGKIGKLIVSVKGGKTINPSMVRDLSGAIEARKAQMGVLITLAPATRGVTDAINHGGVFTHPSTGHSYPRLQHITVADLLAKKRPQVPPVFEPYDAVKANTVTSQHSPLYATA